MAELIAGKGWNIGKLVALGLTSMLLASLGVASLVVGGADQGGEGSSAHAGEEEGVPYNADTYKALGPDERSALHGCGQPGTQMSQMIPEPGFGRQKPPIPNTPEEALEKFLKLYNSFYERELERAKQSTNYRGTPEKLEVPEPAPEMFRRVNESYYRVEFFGKGENWAFFIAAAKQPESRRAEVKRLGLIGGWDGWEVTFLEDCRPYVPVEGEEAGDTETERRR